MGVICLFVTYKKFTLSLPLNKKQAINKILPVYNLFYQKYNLTGDIAKQITNIPLTRTNFLKSIGYS